MAPSQEFLLSKQENEGSTHGPRRQLLKVVKQFSTFAFASQHSELQRVFPLFLLGLSFVCFISFDYWISNTTHHGPSSKNYCGSAAAIGKTEFLQRQTSLAELLHTSGSSAYIAEPGANTQFYGNISQSLWSLSERPFLLIITPVHGEHGVYANVSILAPKFEASRAKMLPIPGTVQYIEWPEDTNPYIIAASALPDKAGLIFVDNTMRRFISDGLQEALPHTSIIVAPPKISYHRERKSKAELALLKCANEATLLAIREVHKKLYIGIHESEARAMMATALAVAGLKDGKCLTLFGDNAALPHGAGTDRALGLSDFALFDCTASLHGYYSDVTRTVALQTSRIPEKHRQVWNYVHSAQTMASLTAHAGALTREVDEAARSFLGSVGYASHFTHRLGHGIGLEVHEHPYLRGGSSDIIQAGHTFSNEPGIYIEGKLGVRLEDCFFINEGGTPVFFTAGVGGQSTSPWSP